MTLRRGGLIVLCEGVRNLEFKQPWTGDICLHTLEVRDVRSRQLEGLAFQVVDIEQEWLSFDAATFVATVTATPGAASS